MAKSFVHLHVHTEHAIGDANARVDELCARAVGHGMPALAITDHGYLHGVPPFVRAAAAAGLTPIIGLEAYLALDPTRLGRGRGRPGCGEDRFGHLTLWAADDTGLRNLFRLASRSTRPGEVEESRPVTGLDLLAECAPGLIGTTGCAAGEVQGYLRQGRYDDALDAAGHLRDILGPDNLYVEIVAPHLLSTRVRHGLVQIGRDLNLPLVATNDVHYVDPEDAAANDLLVRIGDRARTHAPGTLPPGETEWDLKSPTRMRALFAELPEACDITLDIAERCTATFPSPEPTPWRAPVPDGHTEHSWLTHLVHRGLAERYPDGIPEPARARAAEELRVIDEQGRAGHFLVVAEHVDWAHEQGIVVGPGRAVNAGSICNFALRISELDPLEHGLVFERLLNPDDGTFQGVSVDVDARRVAEVTGHVVARNGPQHVARAGHPLRFFAGKALREAARLIDCPDQLANRVQAAVPFRLPLGELYNAAHDRYSEGERMRRLCHMDDRVGEMVRIARALEGLTRGGYIQNWALLVSEPPMEDLVPVVGDPDGVLVTQFPSEVAVRQGAMRLELLPQEALSTIAGTLTRLQRTGVNVRLSDLTRAPSDRTTYRMLNRGNTTGVFQLSDPRTADLLRDVVPDRFADLVAFTAMTGGSVFDTGVVAAYARRKHGMEPVDYPHPELAEVLPPVLGETHGLLLYQEQVMHFAHALAGYSLGEADHLRRLLDGRSYRRLDEEFLRFQAGMLARAHSLDAAEAAWNWLWETANTTALKAQVAGYAMISYWMAWLKAHYPSEFRVAAATTQREAAGLD